MNPPHLKIGIALQKKIGFEQLGGVVHPREKHFLALGKAIGSAFAAGAAFCEAVGPDFGTQRLEYLQAVKMVSVIMADDHALDRLLRNLPNQTKQFFGQRRRGERIEDDHAIARDDKPGVGHEALIFTGRSTRQALHKVAVGAHLDGFHGHGSFGHVGLPGQWVRMGSRQQA